MSVNRIAAILAITVMTLVCVTYALAAQGSASTGPALGKWEFSGKDNTGLVWTGTLSIEKLDPARFDPKQYHALCSLEVESTDQSKGTRGVEAPCEWNPRTRTVSFTTGHTVTHLYTAVLSADGQALTGKWTETKKQNSGQSGETIVRSGTWSAKLPGK